MFGYFWGWRRGCCNCSPDVFTKDVRSENSWTEKYNGNFSLTVSRLDSFVWPLTLETICFKILYKKCKIMIDVLEKWTPLSNDMILLHSSLPCFSSNYNSSKELGMFIYLHIISPVQCCPCCPSSNAKIISRQMIWQEFSYSPYTGLELPSLLYIWKLQAVYFCLTKASCPGDGEGMWYTASRYVRVSLPSLSCWPGSCSMFIYLFSWMSTRHWQGWEW